MSTIVFDETSIQNLNSIEPYSESDFNQDRNRIANTDEDDDNDVSRYANLYYCDYEKQYLLQILTIHC